MTDIFSNDQIYPDGLPAAHELDYEGLDRRHLTQLRIGFVILALVMLIVLLISLATSGGLFKIKYFAGGLGIWLVLSILLLLCARLVYKRRSFAVRRHDISYKSGVPITRLITIPFHRIQHCDISRSLTDQYFDLSKLNIYTAGGSSSDITIPGLSMEAADKLKAYILSTSTDEEE